MQWSIRRTAVVISIIIAVAATLAFAEDGSPSTLPVAHRSNHSAYVVTNSNDFGKLNLATGKYRHIGTIQGLSAPLGGLGRVHGELYGGEIRTGNLYRIDRRTGSATLVGVSGISYFVTGSTRSGLYAVGQDLSLYNIDPENGAATLIGPTGFNPATAGGGALSSGAEKLYMSAAVLGYYDASLYELDTATGTATAIGPIGSGTGAPPMVFEGGALYAGVNFPSQQVCRLDPLTGSPSCSAKIRGLPGYIYGLAPAFRAAKDLDH